MRLLVRHETTYRYATPASAVIQHLRMTPRGYEGLFIRKWRVEIDADYRLDRGEDAFGNILHTYTAEGPVEELRILVMGDVETTDTAGITRLAVERFPMIFWKRPTDRTTASPDIVHWAQDTAAGEGGDRLATLHQMNASLHATMKIVPSMTDGGLTASKVFDQRAGTPTDAAHVLIAAARSLDIPARCIGGYRLPKAGQEGLETRLSWVEAYVEGIGWVGFDPSTGMSTTEGHIRVAAGLDYLDCCAVRGAQTGGSAEVLSVELKVTQGPAIIES